MHLMSWYIPRQNVETEERPVAFSAHVTYLLRVAGSNTLFLVANDVQEVLMARERIPTAEVGETVFDVLL
jgi:hypothetical protein